MAIETVTINGEKDKEYCGYGGYTVKWFRNGSCSICWSDGTKTRFPTDQAAINAAEEQGFYARADQIGLYLNYKIDTLVMQRKRKEGSRMMKFVGLIKSSIYKKEIQGWDNTGGPYYFKFKAEEGSNVSQFDEIEIIVYDRDFVALRKDIYEGRVCQVILDMKNEGNYLEKIELQ